MTTIAGIFENQTVVQQAVKQLEKAGYAGQKTILPWSQVPVM